MKKEKALHISTGIAIAVAVCIILSFIAMPFVAGLGGLIWFATPRQYITTDFNEYGNYIGNYNNEIPQEFINSFFPDAIEDNYTNVRYEYRAQKNDTYAYEAYLEFEITDSTEFQAFITKHIGNNASDFPFDPSFKEYVISDKMGIRKYPDDSGLPGYSIQEAKIGKILYSEETQRIIFVAIGVYDGGFVSTDFLCNYFNRFHIDPAQHPNVKVMG